MKSTSGSSSLPVQGMVQTVGFLANFKTRDFKRPAVLLEALPVNLAFNFPTLAHHAEMLGGQS